LLLGVLLGALASLTVRGVAKYYRDRVTNEEHIAAAEGMQPRQAFTLDALVSANALRRARGHNRGFLMNSVGDLLKTAAAPPPKRDQVTAILAAMKDCPLPGRVRRALNQELSHLTRLSSAADLEVLKHDLDRLEDEAKAGFRRRFQYWLVALRGRLNAERRDLAERASGLDAEQHEIFEASLGMLDQLVEDASELFTRASNEHIGLDSEHVALLERIEPTLGQLRAWLDSTTGRDLEPLLDILYCNLTAVPVPSPAQIDLPSTCKLKLVSPSGRDPSKILALVEQEFELSGIPVSSVPLLRFRWTVVKVRAVGGQEEVLNGGPRLTWLFADQDRSWNVPFWKRLAATGKRVVVEVSKANPDDRFIDEKNVVIENETVTFSFPNETNRVFRVLPDASRIRRMRIHAWLAQQGAVIVGTGVVGAAAAVYWMDKPFGNWSDYLNLLAAGVGVDAGTSSAALKGLLDRFAGPRQPEVKS
jgi:hypothetical protein